MHLESSHPFYFHTFFDFSSFVSFCFIRTSFFKKLVDLMSSLASAHKYHKGSKNLRKLLISAPISPLANESNSYPSLRSPLTGPVVILKVKFDFEGQGSPELSVKKNELCMPIERRTDGWLHVQCLDRNAKGLIPSLYAEIVVNDPRNPIAMDWFSGTIEISKNEEQHVDRVIVSQVLLNETHRLCYRVEAVLKCDRIIKCCKVYEDFEDLVRLVNKQYSSIKQFTIPAQLVSHVSPIKCSETTKKDITTVALGLNIFIQELKRFLMTKDCTLLVNFLLNDDFNVKVGSLRNFASAPVIVDLLAQPTGGLLPIQRCHSFSPTAPLPQVIRPDYKRCTSAPREDAIYSRSNHKYLTYLMASKSEKQFRTNESGISRSDSDTSLLSLIESYDVTSWDVYDQRDGVPGVNSEDLQKCRKLHDSSETGKHGMLYAHLDLPQISSCSSFSKSVLRSVSSSSTAETSRIEPSTPPLKHGSLSLLVLPGPHAFEEKDFDLSPLQPRMHQEFLQSVTANTRDIY